MHSLEFRVIRQRDALLARGPGIRFHAERVRARLRHPAVLIPAFLAGMLVARGAPFLLYAFPRFTARLREITDDLRKLDASVKVLVTLTATSRQPCDTEAGAQPGPTSDITEHRTDTT